MNTYVINNKIYYFESVWRDRVDDRSKDTDGNVFPYPKEGTKWTNKENFLSVLKNATDLYDKKKKFFKVYKNPKPCLLCGEKNVATKLYKHNNYIWEDSLYHYVDVHNTEPTEKFMDMIYFDVSKKKCNSRLRVKCDVISKNNVAYVKLEKNQIMIMDALMYHGGYTKKYANSSDNMFRYSEHAGILDFEGRFLDKIIVSGRTERIDKGDDDIYLPSNMNTAIDYEYLFHTHPPTPRPGGRVKSGVLYEFPSTGDILHFIDHFNDGKTQGSIVITPEGMYNIRKLVMDSKKIKIDEDDMFRRVTRAYSEIQNEAIDKYGTRFSSYEFYSKISQDINFIEKLNNILQKFELHIDFFPRRRDNKGKWIIDSIYLPLYK